MSKLIYLASPYSHELNSVRQQRFLEVCRIYSELTYRKLYVFCPIAMNHNCVLYGDKPLSGGWDYWKTFDELFLSKCDVLYIATMDGWKDSKGVDGEIKYAILHNIPIFYLNPNTLEITKEPEDV